MKILMLLFLVSLSFNSFAKEPDPDAVLAEGKHLYRLEKASWHATDDFLIRFAHKVQSGGGYVSYQTDEGLVNTVFFDKDNPDKLLVRYTFDSVPKPVPLIIDTIDIDVTPMEKDLIAIKEHASKLATIACRTYENTELNFIPVISEKENKVYILTAAKEHRVVLIGNDYLFTYDKDNKFKDMKRIHRSLIEIPGNMEKENKDIVSTMHSHVVSDIIDPTDICTLLLYRDQMKGSQHLVIGKKYVSIFDMEKEELTVMPKKEWEKISKLKKDI